MEALGLDSYERINVSEPLSIEAHARALPPASTARGMLLNALVQTTERECGQRPRQKPYTHFKDYPLVDFVHLARDCQRYAFPRGTIRQSLYRFGLDVFPMLSQTMIGRTVFGIAPHDWGRTLELALKSDALLNVRPGTAKLIELRDRSAVLGLRNVWSFADCYNVGMFEGGMTMFGLRGSVKLRRYSACDVDLLLTW